MKTKFQKQQEALERKRQKFPTYQHAYKCALTQLQNYCCANPKYNMNDVEYCLLNKKVDQAECDLKKMATECQVDSYGRPNN